MDNATKEKFAAGTDQTALAYGEAACLETPPLLFAELHGEFNFSIDLTANETNHLLPVWYGPGSALAVDCLTTPWAGPWSVPGRAGYSNPPYGHFVHKVLKKAILEMGNGFTSVFLLPMRAGGWYKKLVLPYADEVRHVDRRVLFYYQGKPKPTWSNKSQDWILTGALFDSIIVVYRPVPKYRDMLHPGPHFSVWDYPRPKTSKRIKELT